MICLLHEKSQQQYISVVCVCRKHKTDTVENKHIEYLENTYKT